MKFFTSLIFLAFLSFNSLFADVPRIYISKHTLLGVQALVAAAGVSISGASARTVYGRHQRAIEAWKGTSAPMLAEMNDEIKKRKNSLETLKADMNDNFEKAFEGTKVLWGGRSVEEAVILRFPPSAKEYFERRRENLETTKRLQEDIRRYQAAAERVEQTRPSLLKTLRQNRLHAAASAMAMIAAIAGVTGLQMLSDDTLIELTPFEAGLLARAVLEAHSVLDSEEI